MLMGTREKYQTEGLLAKLNLTMKNQPHLCVPWQAKLIDSSNLNLLFTGAVVVPAQPLTFKPTNI
jgi:hypothetical protein